MRRYRWYHSWSMSPSMKELRMSMVKKHDQKSAIPMAAVKNKGDQSFCAFGASPSWTSSLQAFVAKLMIRHFCHRWYFFP